MEFGGMFVNGKGKHPKWGTWPSWTYHFLKHLTIHWSRSVPDSRHDQDTWRVWKVQRSNTSPQYGRDSPAITVFSEILIDFVDDIFQQFSKIWTFLIIFTCLNLKKLVLWLVITCYIMLYLLAGPPPGISPRHWERQHGTIRAAEIFEGLLEPPCHRRETIQCLEMQKGVDQYRYG